MPVSETLRRRWKPIAAAAVVAAAGLFWLAFGYFGVHTLFIDDRVDEDGPVFASGVDAGTDLVAEAGSAPDETEPDERPGLSDETEPGDAEPAGAEAGDADTEVAEPEVAEPEVAGPETAEPDETTPVAEQPTPTVADAEPEPVEPAVVELAEGSFVGRSHPAEGKVVVLNDGTEQRFLRFEDFATDNGPDLNVYLVAGVDAAADEGLFDDDFVDLGDLKGNIGSQNYELPPDLDLDRYSTVVIWCVRFAVAFGAADLS